MYRLKLAGVKNSTILKIFENFNSYEEIFKMDKNILGRYLGVDEVDKIYTSKKFDLEKEMKKLKELGMGLISIRDDLYPEDLRNISQPPTFLYYKGDIKLLKGRKIGVVGTRKATTYGRISCEKIVRELVENEVTIVSGLALGIDRISHEVALRRRGKTIAVVGSGLNVIYPRENRQIWEEIIEKGLLISEFPPGEEPMPYNFPMRNRIIVGLSRGILVVESKKKGGSLITAEIALEENRDVYAVPGDIFSPCSEGTNSLIANSEARLVRNAKEILEEFGWDKGKKQKEKKLNLTEHELKIYNVLEIEKNLDEILMECPMSVGEVLSILMDLEVKKMIASLPGGKYRRRV